MDYLQQQPILPEPWYKTDKGIIILLILFFPAGLFLVWKHAAWSNVTKIAMTSVFVSLVLIALVSSTAKPTNTALDVQLQQLGSSLLAAPTPVQGKVP